MIAIPWFVLTTTGSAALTGVVAFAEMAPYLVAKALGGRSSTGSAPPGPA